MLAGASQCFKLRDASVPSVLAFLLLREDFFGPV
jgi:hypothetical protein